jgi:hypothetical protein
MLNPLLGVGILLAIVSGLMKGTFTRPRRFLDRWRVLRESSYDQ